MDIRANWQKQRKKSHAIKNCNHLATFFLTAIKLLKIYSIFLAVFFSSSSFYPFMVYTLYQMELVYFCLARSVRIYYVFLFVPSRSLLVLIFVAVLYLKWRKYQGTMPQHSIWSIEHRFRRQKDGRTMNQLTIRNLRRSITAYENDIFLP